MKKCAVWTAAGVVVLVVLSLAFPKVRDWVAYEVDQAHQWLTHKVISPEDQLALLERKLPQIDVEINGALGQIAHQMAAVERLKKDVVDGQARLDNEKKALLTMKGDLESGNQTISYNGVDYPAERIREKLTRDFATYKTAEKALAQKKALLAEKEKALDAAKDQVAAMRSQKEQLELQLEELKTKLQAVRADQTKSNFQLDDSQLSQMKADMADLSDRIEAQRNELTLQQQFADTGSIKVEQKVKQNEVLKDLDDYFGKTPADKVAEQK